MFEPMMEMSDDAVIKVVGVGGCVVAATMIHFQSW